MTVLKSESIVTSRLTSLESLHLPTTWQNQIQKIIQENRMLYEPWIETAVGYNDLRVRLKDRGFKNIPMGENPMLKLDNFANAPKANTSSCQVTKTMIRKKK